MGKKWGVCKRVKAGEVQKVHFLCPKGPHFGCSAPPIDPDYGPAYIPLTKSNPMKYVKEETNQKEEEEEETSGRIKNL